MTSSIKAFAMLPIMRYGFRVIKWSLTELKIIDRKTRKLLHEHQFNHHKSNTHRLYLPRNLGGRGLIGVFDFHRQECTALANYISKSGADSLVKITRDIESTKNGVMSYLIQPKVGNVKMIEDEHLDELKKMKLHGQYFNK